MEIEYFVAPDDRAAAATRDTGPGGAFASHAYTGYYPDDAAALWESHLTGDPDAEPDHGLTPRSLAPVTCDACQVFALSPALQGALAVATPAQLRGLAARWVAVEAADDGCPPISRDAAEAVLTTVARLAREAAAPGTGSVYCWWCP